MIPEADQAPLGTPAEGAVHNEKGWVVGRGRGEWEFYRHFLRFIVRNYVFCVYATEVGRGVPIIILMVKPSTAIRALKERCWWELAGGRALHLVFSFTQFISQFGFMDFFQSDLVSLP